ncbi:MAG: ATP phosphoribosyltransferase regulatory subunit [Bauldia sp.]|nr:ATP phosphoribosyltransferase regulatory subunit [Bauldia sp.]
MEAPLDKLRARLTAAGYGFVEPPILHDADLFLDLAGEDLRRRLFLTGAADGVELCLRPDYTIPVALHHLTAGDPRRLGAYAYCGPVFRQRSGETGEFTQAGVESIGRTDRGDADAEMLALALDAVSLYDVTGPTIRIGDSALFAAMLDSLPVPEIWRKRLRRAFGDPARIVAVLDQLSGERTGPRPGYAGLLAALNGADHMAARKIVDDLLAVAGIRPVGGRSAAEIAERFVEQAALTSGSEADRAAAALLRRFLAVRGSPDEAALALGAIAAADAPALAPAIERFVARTDRLIDHGIGPDRLDFAADFGRRLDYYTGFVFELYADDPTTAKPVAGGGRYDRLLSLIVSRDGSGADIPAVGFALWLDRLERR